LLVSVPYHGGVVDVEWQAGVPGSDWDAELFAEGGHFLQSSHWLSFRSALGHTMFFGRGDGWRCAAYHETGYMGPRLYCPYGPLVTSGDRLDAALAGLAGLAKEVGVTYVRIEPVGAVSAASLAGRGLRPSPRNNQPALTWVKDLDGTTDELLGGMYKSNRVRYRSAAANGLSFHTSTAPSDVDFFLAMVHEVATRTGIQPHPDDYYRTMARTLMPRGAMTLYLARHEGDPVAGVLALDSPVVRYTTHSGSFPVARKLHAASPLRTQIILDAHAAGQRQVDFWGVAPADQPDHPWAGFSKFKRSFGGRYHEYAGTWDMPV
jgi:lipid II:glycine glycyltransferase (peptidoglycan interpeptide bridge formation enzyme)